jgi:phenylacetate-CoA ligase
VSLPSPAADAQAWDWPYRLPPTVGQRMLDVHAFRTLENSGHAMQLHFQGTALNALVGHARQASAWWREWLKPPPGVPGVPLQEMPILQRADFRAAVESAGGALPLPPLHGGVAQRSTSGSTGVPVSFFISQLASRMVDAQYFADHARHGRDLRLKLAALLTRFEEHPGIAHRVLPADPLLGTSAIAARRSLGYPMRQHAAWLRTVNPAYLNTAPSVLAGLLQEYEEGEPAPTALRQVMTVGETVPPSLRERTRRVLGATIRDRYTCEEVGPIALQCPHDTSDDPAFHTCTGNAIVEVVDDAGKPCAAGQPGRVLVTGLHHWASPAIRYDIGDVAALSPQCACGAQVPTLTRLLGRKRFLIRLPSGERKFLKLVASDWLKIAPVREHRVTQHAEQAIRVELVMDRPLEQDEKDRMLGMLREAVHPSFEFDIQQVAAIAWAPGAKRQDVVSLV